MVRTCPMCGKGKMRRCGQITPGNTRTSKKVYKCDKCHYRSL